MTGFQKAVERFGLSVGPDWCGLDPVLPIIDAIRGEGAVVILKFDGERGPDDNGQFTVVASSGPLGADYLRCEGPDLQRCLERVIGRYYDAVWDTPTQ